MHCVGSQRFARKMLRASSASLAVLLAMGSAGIGHAQAPASPTVDAASTNAMVNLIRLLVKQGTITPANGEALLAQAQGEAERARANVVEAAANAGVAPPPEGTVRVPYVPAGVRKQIVEQVRTEVMAQAKAEGWAAPGNAAPDWTRKIKVSGDIRFRSQSELYSRKNSTDFPDIAQLGALNVPINLTDVHNLPVLNTTEDRVNRLRMRARLSVDAEIAPQIKAGFTIATGDDNSPISTNEALAGGLRKRALWLDRAYFELEPFDWMRLDFGRMPNPFRVTERNLGRIANTFRTTQLLFDDDLMFDGVAAEVRADQWLPKGFSLALRGGAFPLDNGPSNFPETNQDKSSYPSKWLLSGQVQWGYRMQNGISLTGAAAYHDFRNVQGQLSSVCPFNGVNNKYLAENGAFAADPSECSTDGSRAMSPRKGNTLFWIRQLGTPPSALPDVVEAERQYLGLVQPFRILDISGSVSFPLDDEVNATLSGNFLANLAYRRRNACRYGAGSNQAVDNQAGVPFNNIVANGTNYNACTLANPAQLVSGNKGWMVDLTVGHAHPRRWGEWRVSAGYRYLQSDAVMDSYTDSDFHLGGTNTKGYTVFGAIGLYEGVALGARWLSSNEVRGEPLAIDVLQIDLQAEF